MENTYQHFKGDSKDMLETLTRIPWPEPRMVILGNNAFHKQVQDSTSAEDIRRITYKNEPVIDKGKRPNFQYLEEFPADVEIGPGIIKQIEDRTL